ncbi:MAG TPA: glutamate ABC transporter substrate-binding protein [Nocardioides sp.]|nr:glutamate ABC transporter substrate-binding protein [Nocardioides sp.]
MLSRGRRTACAAALLLVLPLAACSDDGRNDDAIELTGTPEDLAEAGTIRIGVKYDQPGIGLRPPGAAAPEGFDIEIGRIIADRLGIEEADITWVEAVSESREQLLEGGSFDLVVASYSITDERRELVGQAGPYFTTGQQLLIRAEDETTITGPDDLAGREVCSVKGSTSLDRVVTEYAADPVGFTTYSECVDQLREDEVDAVTTDGAILLGYAAQRPNLFRVVGEPFSEERYGIGYPKDADGMCHFLSEVLERSFEDGTWAEAFDTTLGMADVETPEPPELDDCE